MKRPGALVIALLATAIASQPLLGQQITAAFMPDLPPFSFVDSQGQRTGFYIDLLEALADDLGFEVSYNQGSWGENLELTRRGEIDLLIAVTRTAERAEFLDYLDETVLAAYTQIVANRQSTIETVLDLDKKSVGIMTGDRNGEAFLDFIDEFDVQIELNRYADYTALLSAVSSGEVDAAAVSNLIDLEGYPLIFRTSIIFNAYSTTYATAKGENWLFMQQLNARLARWKSDPNSPYNRLFESYFGESGRRVIPPWIISSLIVLIIAVVASALSVSILTRKLRAANVELKSWGQTLEEKVKQRTRQMEESQRRMLEAEKTAGMGTMVAGVAHEINTPIGVALTASTLLEESINSIESKLKKDQISREDFQRFLDTTRKSSDMVTGNISRAAELIQSFKEVSIDQVSEDQRIINVREYCRSVLSNLYPLIKDSGHSHTLDAPDAEIETVPGLISRILANLYENAILHGLAGRENGHIHIRISLSAGAPDTVYLDFSDDGNGIPEDIRERVFEPFVSSKKFQGSSGLGLSIVHNIVTSNLRGQIQLEKNSSTGSRFIITFPCRII